MNNKYYKNCAFKLFSAVMLILLGVCSACTATNSGSSVSSASSSLQEIPIGRPFDLSKKASEAYAQSNWFDAIRFYRALTLDLPEDAYSWFRLANSHVHQGEFEKAVVYYQRSLQYDRSQARAWFNLSTALLLSAQDALRRAGENISSSDSASIVLENRLQELDDILSSN